MNTTFRGARRALLPFALTTAIALGGATAARAQTAPAAKSDSAAATKPDSAHAQQPKKRGFFARAMSAASHAATAVQQTTGVDPKAALEGAALVAAKANPAAAMMQAMQAAQQAQGAQGAQIAGAGIAGRLGNVAGMGMASAMGAAQMQAMQRMQQMMLAGPASGAGAPSNPELSALQLQVTQMAMLAAHGDRNAMTQLMRFQGEMAGAMTRLGGLAPAQQQSALPAAMRAAIACATSGQQCTSGRK